MSKRTFAEEVLWRARRRGRRAVHKRDVIARVARRTSLTQGQVREALEAILEVVTETMVEGDFVTLVGFGRFEASEHRPRAVYGRDGNTYYVERRLVPSFRPYPSLRRRVQEQAAAREFEGEELCPEPKMSIRNG
jgi:DNA-binding protein HU-beta